METTTLIDKIRQYRKDLQSFGVTHLYLFGSYARGDHGVDSDVDLFLDYDASSPFSLTSLVRVEDFLGDRLDRHVDLHTRDSLHRRIRNRIEAAAIQIF